MPFIKKNARPAEPDLRRREKEALRISPVRRIERVAAAGRVCAITFEDGPCRLPALPDRFRGKPLTLVLAEMLERYGAKAPPPGTGPPGITSPTSAGTAREARSAARS